MYCFRIVVFLLLSMVFVSCSSKTNIDTLQSQEFAVSSKNKTIFLEVINSSNEKIHVEYDLKKAFENKGYFLAPSNDKNAMGVKVHIMYAGIFDAKTDTNAISEDIYVNVGVGNYSGNVGIFTSIGTTLQRIFGNSKQTQLFQTVVNIQIKQKNQNEKNIQFIFSAPLNIMEKEKLIYAMEEKIVQRSIAIFK